MFEKVNPFHPDKVADRIAGAIVDLAYTRAEGGWAKSNPRIAVEVLIGHGVATVIIETSLNRSELVTREVEDVVRRFLPVLLPDVIIVSQDEHLSRNQQGGIRVGDNGIFKGCPVTDEQRTMMTVAKSIVLQHPSDGKYIINHHICEEDANIKKWIFGRPPRVEWDVIICQSNVSDKQAAVMKDWLFESHLNAVINPLGAWTGGVNVDCGATNRKLGSDMGDAVTGGGLHGKDLSKADVSVNIMCHIKAQASRQVVTACTAIGDTDVTFRYADGTKETLPFAEVVEAARLYIMTQHGSFEHFAEWGLIA